MSRPQQGREACLLPLDASRHIARYTPSHRGHLTIDPDDLDEEFPLGDGTADRSTDISCPYCGALVEISLDPGSGSQQDYVEDCEVCCQPWRLRVRYRRDGSANVTATTLDS